jgi:RND family efflux transporter MFP subunit
MNKIIWAIIILAVGGYLVMNALPDKTASAPKPVADRLSVTVAKPEEKTLQDVLRVTGVTIPRHDVLVTTELTGARVVELLADVGDEIKAGQLLARLDTTSQQNQLEQIQSDYNRALDEFKRINSIKDSGAVSKESVVQKRTAMEAAKARLDDAKLSIERGEIKAPSDGKIYERNINVGGIINGDTPPFRLIGSSEMEVEASVPEADLGRLQVGQTTQVNITGFDHAFSGEVRLISPAINKETRTGFVRVTLKAEKTIPAGVFADVQIILGNLTGVSIPATALQQEAQGTYVWVVGQNNTLMRRDVTVTKRLTNDILIEPIGDVVIVARAGSFVKEGEIVNPVTTSPTGGE